MSADTLPTPPSSAARIRELARVRLAAQGWDVTGPLGPLLMHGAISALLCSLVRENLSPFAFATFALGLSAALVAVPLLGEFGGLLRADPTGDWAEAQPVLRRELRLARTLACLAGVGLLASGSLLPALFLMPGDAGWLARGGLLVGGLEQALCIAALLLWLQGALGERAEGLLVLLQTLLVVGTVVGALAGLRYVPALGDVDTLGGALVYVPPAWFGSVASSPDTALALRLLPHGLALGALLLLAFAPAPKRPEARGRTFASILLRPLRDLGRAAWVRKDERATYELVFEALPLEREFVLRTYPMLGIPLAFLALGAFGDEAELEGRVALLLFTTATYLPILLAHVPVTATPDARWLLDTAPVTDRAMHGGACKAVAVRFVLPLYLALGGLTFFLTDASTTLRLAVPAGALALLLTRALYPMLVHEPPLSTEAEGLRGELGGMGLLMTLAIGLTLGSLFATKMIQTPLVGVVFGAVLIAAMLVVERVAPARAVQASPDQASPDQAPPDQPPPEPSESK